MAKVPSTATGESSVPKVYKYATILFLALFIVSSGIAGYLWFTLRPPQKPKILYHIRIGNVPAVTYTATFIAIEKFLRGEGIEAEYISFPSGGKAREALIAGDLDFASLSTVHVPLARIAGRPLKAILAMHSREIFTLLVRADLKDRVKGVADLKGLTVGFSSPGSGSWAFAIYFLQQAGLDPERDVELLPVDGVTVMYSALKTRKVDATVSWDPLTTVAIMEGEAYPLIDLYDPKQHEECLGKEAMSQILVTREDVIAKYPDLVRRVVRAHEKALKFIKEAPPEEVAELIAPIFEGVKEEVLIEIVRRVKAATPPDGSLSEEAYYTDINPLVLTGVLAKKVTFEEACYWEFAGRRA
ncbi:TPA: ABC transporter substrate-binding protein [Candidatus Bathyarchaeota archaeon]|nr:ABC transporter substrate-binding protein [Candidatus Bathyarchaeota archaeon]